MTLFRPPATGVVLWRPAHGDPRAARTLLRRSFVSTADVAGEPWLRSVAANPMANPDLIVDDVLAALD